jgi:hypothetical protein
MEENNDGGGENLADDFHAADSTETNNGGRKRTLEQTEGTINAISFSLLAFLSFFHTYDTAIILCIRCLSDV